MNYSILIVVGKSLINYSAYAPEVPGCVATGKTLDETIRLMREAVQLHLEGIIEDGDEMPLSADPTDEAHFVEVEVETTVRTLHQSS